MIARLRTSLWPQSVWLATVLAGFALTCAILATQFHSLHTTCSPSATCLSYQLDASSARLLHDHGISLTLFACFTVVVVLASLLLWYSLAGLVISRKPDDRGALLAAFFLVLFPAALVPGLLTPGVWSALGTVLTFSFLFLFLALFPDGNFRPRWSRWTVPLLVIGAIGFPSINILFLFFFPAVFLVVWLQIHRFRKLSSWSERQATKWAFLGLITAVALLLGGLVIPQTIANAQSGSLMLALTTDLAWLVFAPIPVSIGIAILRGRLWDIDRVLSRALSYLILTATLVGVYLGGVIGLQAIFRSITGQQSDVAIAISTLAIAALFNPLRRRIQELIARTFYRRRYDASKVLTNFGNACRDETDLEALQTMLMGVVQETMQPGHVSVWLKETAEA